MFKKLFNIKKSEDSASFTHHENTKQLKLTDQEVQSCIELEFNRRLKKIFGEKDKDFSDERDSLFNQAAEIIVTQQQCSAMMLQRKLNVNYIHAGLLIDQIEASGIIGPFEGNKQRKINIANLAELEIFIKSEGFYTPHSELFNKEYLHLYESEIEERLSNWFKNKSQILNDLDKDNNGLVDVIEGNDFYQLLQKNQKYITEIDREYVQKFIKISNYIKSKKENIQLIFSSISNTKNETDLNEQVKLIKNQIHTYELLVFHSINMIGALVKEDMISFYEIYESFDKLGIFNSNWENEVSNKLTNIGDKLDDLMYAIESMEQNIVSELSHLSYVTQESFADLNASVTKQLQDVESSINLNNLLTGIQAYQMYRINQKTKRIN